MRLAEENLHLPIHKEKKEINSLFFGLYLVLRHWSAHFRAERSLWKLCPGIKCSAPNCQAKAVTLLPSPPCSSWGHSQLLFVSNLCTKGTERRSWERGWIEQRALPVKMPRLCHELTPEAEHSCPAPPPGHGVEPNHEHLCPARSATAPEGKRLDEPQEELVGRQVWASNRDKHSKKAQLMGQTGNPCVGGFQHKLWSSLLLHLSTVSVVQRRAQVSSGPRADTSAQAEVTARWPFRSAASSAFLVDWGVA